ncbi:MAG TPA: O-antigen ligase family protein [Candidatus Binatia bacterium]|jgi:O-antigen ligase|nr:O-antigen ligase family protein [Candidatus Binatia bacterium]
MTTLLITLAAAAVFLALCLWRRSVALAVFCALLPAYLVRFSLPLPGMALPSTLLEVLFWELFLVWAFTDGAERGAWSALADWSEPATLFAVGATVGVLVSPDLRGALGLWRAYVLEPLLFFPMFVAVLAKERRGAWVLGALGGLTAAIGISAVYQKLTGFGIPSPWQEVATRRVTSVFGFPNAIGLFCAPMVVLLAGWTVALVRAKKMSHRMLAALPAAAAFLGALAILFAVSEGGAIGAAAGLFALGLFDKKLRVPALGLLIAACVLFIAYRPATDYASYIISLRDDSGSVRQVIWRETAEMLRDNPVFGAGLAGYRGRIAPYHHATWIEIFMYPHDIVLNFWSETGLLGLAGFFWIVGRFFARAWRAGRKSWIVPAAAAAMVTMLVHGLVDVPYFKNDLAFLFWAVVGMVESVRRVADESALEKAKDALAGKPSSPWIT